MLPCLLRSTVRQDGLRRGRRREQLRRERDHRARGALARRAARLRPRGGILRRPAAAIPSALRRFGLVVTQIHAIGNRSLVIIAASGTAVGFVLALQMYYALVTTRRRVARPEVNLALVRTGPVVTALSSPARAGRR